MRSIIAVLVCMVVLLSGCGATPEPIDKAMEIRNAIEASNGCAFTTTVTADYGDKTHVFTMNCQVDKEGNLEFEVVEPDTISGITGNISGSGGALTFDDKVLAFQNMADGLVAPATAPWILVKTLKSGYIKGCAETESGFEISADDSYAEGSLHLNIAVKGNSPTQAEIFWNEQRILTLVVENFHYL